MNTTKVRWGRLAVYWIVLIGILWAGTVMLESVAHAGNTGDSYNDLSIPVKTTVGFASYYTTASCQKEGTSGVFTANGERYNEQALTCALPRRDFGKKYLVCGENGCAEVRHNDYGPGKKPQSKGVVIDLTPKAFKEVCGELRQGLCEVGVMGITA